ERIKQGIALSQPDTNSFYGLRIKDRLPFIGVSLPAQEGNH
ncbi:MAG: hypothetical protein ACI8Y3_001415, partial [Paraglaciecola sp.]